MKVLSITHCSALKTVPSRIRLGDFVGDQAAVTQNWLSKVNSSDSYSEALSLYKGRGFKLLLSQAKGIHPIYVVSAGLGLIKSESQIPSYDCTIASGLNSSLNRFCEAKPDLTEWWQSLQKNKFSVGSIHQAAKGFDCILVSLTSPYLKMVTEDLKRVGCKIVLFTGPGNNLDFCGANLTRAPYTDVFDGPDGLERGTKSNFAQRCHADFIKRLHRLNNIKLALASVSTDMNKWAPTKKLNNQRLSDERISSLISQHKKQFKAINAMHKFFRHELNVACEQKRFSKLYKQVLNNDKN